jgi:hypothetical protein
MRYEAAMINEKRIDEQTIRDLEEEILHLRVEIAQHFNEARRREEETIELISKQRLDVASARHHLSSRQSLSFMQFRVIVLRRSISSSH